MLNTKSVYFTDANTCKGYYSFLSQIFDHCENKFLIKNLSSQSCDILLRNVIGFCERSNLEYNMIMQPGYTEKPCGLYIPRKKMLIYSLPFFRNTSVANDIIDAAQLSDKNTERLSCLSANFEYHCKQMYYHLTNAKKIHDDWEKIYISNMNFEKADKLADETVSEIFQNVVCQNKTSANSDRFFGTMLPCGSVNYINTLTYGLKKRIFIKGRPGTGKSTFLKKIRAAAISLGFDTETYYCSFDPQSLDMVIIRDLSVCVFDSTSPHEMFPSCDSDSIVDIYETAVTPGTDEKYSDILNTLYLKYDFEMADAKKHLSDIHKIYAEADELFEKYNDDFVNTATKHILSALS